MATFVLVHGAFHGGWCWIKLVPELNSRGHRVIAPDMPGAGDDTTPLAAVSMQAVVSRLCDLIAGAGEPVVLVGHSLAGMAISQVAEDCPHRIRRLVYLAALVPQDGDTLHSLMARMTDPECPGETLPPIHDSWEGVAQEPPLLEVEERFYNDCAADDIAYARALLKPQPNALRLARVHLTPARFGRVPKSFVSCELDNAMPAYRRRLNIDSGQFDQVLSMQTGHSPFFSQPAALADLLGALVRPLHK